MRVITGKARGVNLKTPEGLITRPTADRVKEALFSVINFDIPEEVVESNEQQEEIPEFLQGEELTKVE